jgi:2'-hydroxyisoflavone reductase
LILGGTRFLGRAFAEVAIQAGYQVSLFHRGQTGADLFPEVEHILGDRNHPLSALQGRTFDYVVDTSGQLPTQVENSVQALCGAHYTFVSSISVYANHSEVGRDESAQVVDPSGCDLSQELPSNYAERKVACERALPSHALILRPGLIVGPHDPTDRFTYWVARGAGWGGNWGAQMLAPGTPRDPIQWIDARDLAIWALQLARQGKTGTYNALGPPTPMGQVLEQVAISQRLSWLPAAYLLEQQVAPWKDLPAWLPPEGESRGFTQFNPGKALDAGLRLRSAAESAQDILNWRRQQGTPLAAGLTHERERQLIEGYHP